jgi:cytochrome c556
MRKAAYPILFLLGLAIGAVLATIWANTLRKRDAYPDGVMALMGAQMGSLDKSVKANRCATSDLLPRLQTLRAVANDIEPAFQEDDEAFGKHASALRAAADAALATPPANCAAAAATLDRIDHECSGCHREFKG